MIEGEITIFLSALDAPADDPRLRAAIAHIGGTPTVESYDDGDTQETYLVMSEHGGDVLLIDGTVHTVFLYASTDEEHGAYARFAALIDGIDESSTREGVQAALGDPLRAAPSYLTYAAGAGYVQFDFDTGVLSKIVVMRELVGGMPSASATDAGDAARPAARAIEGELSAFIDALGAPLFSSEHLALLGLIGPASESRDEVRDGVTWQYEDSERSGVLLQFKQERLAGALIRLTGDDGTYPAPDRLIAGLDLPADRATVRASLGQPVHSREDMDLYLAGDAYVRVDYDDDRSTDLSVVASGVGV